MSLDDGESNLSKVLESDSSLFELSNWMRLVFFVFSNNKEAAVLRLNRSQSVTQLSTDCVLSLSQRQALITQSNQAKKPCGSPGSVGLACTHISHMTWSGNWLACEELIYCLYAVKRRWILGVFFYSSCCHCWKLRSRPDFAHCSARCLAQDL